MPARTIDGRAIAQTIERGVAEAAAAFSKEHGRRPRLVAVLVGDDPGSVIYLRRKAEAATRVGIESTTQTLPPGSSERDVWAALDALARDEKTDGILLQLPLPQGLSAERLLDRIPAAKDIDAFHPVNVGLNDLGRATLRPCTAQAVMEILDHERTHLEGAEVVIVNHSHVVGRPLAQLLLNRNATVTVCHKFTKDLAAHTSRADVLVSATGVPGLIARAHVKPGAVVIDVGIARRPDGSITGDVRFDEVKEVAAALTPVPGGVGPLTVAVLMRNVVAAATARASGHR